MLGITRSNDFWQKLDQLVATSHLIIDRPRGTKHPRYPTFIYPFDYGYLEDVKAGDSEGIDVWIGSLTTRQVTGIVCSVDLEKRDTEIKILLDCTSSEIQTILDIHNIGSQSALAKIRT